MKIEYLDGVEYRYVEIRGRGKFISKDGLAFNPKRKNQKATMHINQDGYPCFGGGVPVHLYVAYAWVNGYFDGAEVNHKDFNRANFNSDNLEWVTHSQNIEYSHQYNYEEICKSKQGIHNGRATFSENQVLQIRKMAEQGMSTADIVRVFYPELKKSKQYKSIHSTFLNIVNRNTWKHI